MNNIPVDANEVKSLPLDATPLPDSPADRATLMRAFRHGAKAQGYFPGCGFADAEAELRAGWLLNGETSPWRFIRDAVRQGFECDLSDRSSNKQG